MTNLERLPTADIPYVVTAWASEPRESPQVALAVFARVEQARDVAERLWEAGGWSEFRRSAGLLRLKNERGDTLLLRSYRQEGRGLALDRLFFAEECPAGSEVAFIPCLVSSR